MEKPNYAISYLYTGVSFIQKCLYVQSPSFMMAPRRYFPLFLW